MKNSGLESMLTADKYGGKLSKKKVRVIESKYTKRERNNIRFITNV